MELKVYLDFLARRWWLLLFGPLVAAGAAFLVTQQMTPIYQATATVLVNRTATPGTLEYDDVLTSERLTNTYAELVESPQVLDDTIERLGLAGTREHLADKISVAVVKETQLLEISASDPNPEFAARLANTMAAAFADDIAGQLAPVGTVSVVKQAQTPPGPVSPRLFLNVAFAVLLGGMLAAGLGLLLDYLDDTVKTHADVEKAAGVPALAIIGRFRSKSRTLHASEFNSRYAEAYRQLRTNVRFTGLGTGLKTIVVTSAHPEEGKSTTASNLAAVLAQAGDRVILVDADLRRSSLRETFDGAAGFGLTGLLYNDLTDPSLALVSTQWRNLRLLPAGVLPPNPSELLTSARMMRLFDRLRTMADYLIFDTPPVLAVTDASVLAARADGTLLVAEAGKTRNDALQEAARTLSQAKAKVIGVVLNKANVKATGYYYYRSKGDDALLEISAESFRPPEPLPAVPEYIARTGTTTPAGESSNGHSPVDTSEPRPAVAVAARREAAPLSDDVSDLLSRFGETMGLLRSLKPPPREREDNSL